MLKIPTYLANSEIHGTGLFSVSELKKGQPVYVFDRSSDLQIEVDSVPEYLRDYFDRFGTVFYYDTQRIYDLDGDNCRYMNHSDDPNIVFIGNYGLATRDIEKDEELTCDYRKITIPEHFEYLMLLSDE